MIGKAISVLLVEDHAILRQGLAALLAGVDGVRVCANVGDSAAAFAALREHEPDVAVFDVSLGGEDGIALAARCEVPVVMLTMYDDITTVERALHAGALGYVLKGGGVDELVAAIRAVRAGRRWLDPKLGGAPMVGTSTLSEREVQVLRLVAGGLTSAEIGRELGLATKTVQNHRLRITDKLGIRSTAGLVRYALRAGIAQ